MDINVYLSGEIHSDWRKEIITLCNKEKLKITFTSPVTNHNLSDDCGSIILGNEENKFWHDHKSAKLNAIRTRNLIENADVLIVKFGQKYKQWNAAYDAGYASALGIPIICIHNKENQHALKEIDAAALAVTENNLQVVQILKYVLSGDI